MACLRCTAAFVFALLFVPAAALAQTTCVFSLDHTAASFPANGGNDVVTVGALPSGCSTKWTIASNASWITVSFGNGTGSGSAGYTVTANNTLNVRTGTLTIAGLVFTVTQAAATCNFTASATSTTIGAIGGTGTFAFNASPAACAWTVNGTTDWLTLTSPGSGSGGSTIAFSAAQNTLTASRAATLTVGSLSFTVNQSAACGVSLSPLSATIPAAGGTGAITITLTGSNCNWTATSNNPSYITITGSTSGTTSSSTTYSVAANTTGIDRVGSIGINSAGFSILQPSNCSYGVSPGGTSLPTTGGAGTFTVTATCPWTLTNNSPDWLTANPTSGSVGTTVVTYAAAPGTSATGRSGSFAIGNQLFSVTEAGVPCSVTVNPTSFEFPNTGGSTTQSVNAADGCAWAAATQTKWLTLANPGGSGAGQLTVTADPNSDPAQRSGAVTIANQVVTFTEDAQQCNYLLSPPSATFGSSGGTGTVNVNTQCTWTATSSAPWLNVITASGQGTANLRYSVTRLPTTDSRTATIAVGTATFTVTQTAAPCALTLGDTNITADAESGRGVLKVTGNSACGWSPSVGSDGADWLSISSWENVNGGGLVVYHFSTNSSVSPRQSSIVISSPGIDPLSASVIQQGIMPELSDGGIVNAASNTAGSVSPGEIIYLRGEGLGPAQAVPMQLSEDGTTVLNTLTNVQVMFDGFAAPLLSVSDKEVQAIVPYEIAGQTTTQVTLINQGIVSNPQTLNVGASAPGIFTTDGTHIDARNSVDGSVNSATSPVARNAVITFYVTGEGQTNPAGVDGLLNVAPAAVPLLQVTVQIGGQNATVVAASESVGDVAGKLRIDARVAQQVTPGPSVPVIVRVGPTQTQPGVTIAVK